MTAQRRIRVGSLCAVALVALAGLVYANSLGGPFVLDDLASIRDNPHIGALWPPSHWLALEPQTSLSGRPLVTVTMALCHAVGGLDVRVYHAANLALHLLNAVLLLGLLRVHLGAGAAFAGALLWALHPLNTEAVDYLTQRSELLLGTFYLGALLAAAREKRAVAALCCALGMLCKESMVTAPIAVLLWARVYRFASWRELFARERAFAAGLAASWGVLLAILLLSPRSQSVGFSLDVSALDYAKSQVIAVAHYLRLAVWPHPLAIHYGPVQAVGLRELIAPGLLVAATAGGAVALLLRAPRLGYPAVLIFLLLAPTSSFVPIATEVAAERRMYLPLAALIALAVGAASPLVPRTAFALAAAALAAALGAATRLRNADYASAVSLWESSVAARPELAQGFVNLGIAHAERFEHRAAVDAYRRALELDPADARACYDLALSLEKQGDLDGAIAALLRATALEPDLEPAQLALARARTARGDPEAAASSLRLALAAIPDSVALRLELAQLLLGRRDPQSHAEALEQARSASAESDYRNPAALHTLAAAEWATGQRAQALETQERALELASSAPSELRSRLAEQLARYRAALSR